MKTGLKNLILYQDPDTEAWREWYYHRTVSFDIYDDDGERTHYWTDNFSSGLFYYDAMHECSKQIYGTCDFFLRQKTYSGVYKAIVKKFELDQEPEKTPELTLEEWEEMSRNGDAMDGMPLDEFMYVHDLSKEDSLKYYDKWKNVPILA